MVEIIFFRQAVEEIIKDTKRGAVRAEVSGAYGWKSAPKINSRLFGNTLSQVIQTNKRIDKRRVPLKYSSKAKCPGSKKTKVGSTDESSSKNMNGISNRTCDHISHQESLKRKDVK